MSQPATAKRPRGRPKSAWSAAQPPTVQALDRGLTLLNVLALQGEATLTELTMRVGMPPSSAHRLLATLQKHGFVEFDEASQNWTVGVEAFRIGSAFARRANVVEASRTMMRALMEDTGETANLAISDGGDVIFISQVETHSPIRAFFRPGSRARVHASGIGKALLAEMPRKEVEHLLMRTGLPRFTHKTLTTSEALFADLANIRARGWSLDDEESNLGMRCVAAAIFNEFGEAVAGISVSGPTVRFRDQDMAEIGQKVKTAAAAVTRLIGGKPAMRPVD